MPELPELAGQPPSLHGTTQHEARRLGRLPACRLPLSPAPLAARLCRPTLAHLVWTAPLGLIFSPQNLYQPFPSSTTSLPLAPRPSPFPCGSPVNYMRVSDHCIAWGI